MEGSVVGAGWDEVFMIWRSSVVMLWCKVFRIVMAPQAKC